MPAVLVGFFAIGVALLMLLVAWALTAIFTPIIEGLARNVPVVGGYIARGSDRAISYAAGKLTAWAETGIRLTVGWLQGLRDAWNDLVGAVNAFIVELPGNIEHLAHVTVHEIVKAFVNPVRDLAHDAKALADDALDRVTALRRDTVADLHGIEGKVAGELQRTLDTLRNIDLPDLHRTLDREIDRAAGKVAGEVADVRSWSQHEVAALWDQLGKIPLTQLLDGLAVATGAAALVNVIARESGLDSAECRSKVKGICGTDAGDWFALLGGFAVIGFDFDLEDIAAAGRELVGAIADGVDDFAFGDE